jgi:hypothetical protein
VDTLAQAAARTRGAPQQLAVVERIHGDEQAFRRDYQPATGSERTQTLGILAAVRAQTLTLIAACPDPVGELLHELQRSGAHMQAVVTNVAPALVRRSGGEVWTTTKLLRRLAWHERGELVAMRRLAKRARQHLPDS